MPSGRVSQMAPDQLAWLEDHFEDFCDKQARNTLGLFWPKMERDWFKEWPAEAELGMPVPQVTEEVEEAEVEVTPISDEDKRAIGTATADRKKKLRGWFNNRSQRVKKMSETVKPVQLGEVAASLFKAGPAKMKKKSRAKQPIELFQKRYPELIEAEMQTAGIEDMDILLALLPHESGAHDSHDEDDDAAEKKLRERLKSARLKLRREVTKRLYEGLPEEERMEMETLSEAMKAAAAKKGEEEEAAGREPELRMPAERTPEEYQAEIDALPGILREVHAMIERLTGWTGATILGGPTPRQGGKIMSKTFCFGVSPAGNTLVQAIPEWEEVVTKKMGHWLSRCNPRELRKSRALTTPAATESAATDAISVPEELLPPPKKTRKRKPAKNARRNTAVAVAAMGTDRVVPELPAPESTDSGPNAGEMDWDQRQDFRPLDFSIDLVLLGLSRDQMADVGTQGDSTQAVGKNDQSEGGSHKAVGKSRPTQHATYKGSAAAPVRTASELVEAFGELSPQSGEEPTLQSELDTPPFEFPGFVFAQPMTVRNPLWPSSSTATAASGNSAGTPTPAPGTPGHAMPCPFPTTPTPPSPLMSAAATPVGTAGTQTPTTPEHTAPHPSPSTPTLPSILPAATSAASPIGTLCIPHASTTTTTTSPSTPTRLVVTQCTPLALDTPRTVLITPTPTTRTTTTTTTAHTSPPTRPTAASPPALTTSPPTVQSVIRGAGATPTPSPSHCPTVPSPLSRSVVTASGDTRTSNDQVISPSAPPASAVPGPSTAGRGLTWDNFPQSRPLANAPTAPTERAKPRGRPPGVKGRGKGKGRENPPVSSVATVPHKRKAAELWRQTYDDDGNVVPLDPGAPTGEVSKKRKKELLDMGKRLDEEAEATAVLKEKTRRMLVNPDGLYPAVIWVPPVAGVEASGAEALGAGAGAQSLKRSRRPAKDRNGEAIVLPAKRKRGELQGPPPPPPRA